MTVKDIVEITGAAVLVLGTLFGGAGFLIWSYKKSGRQERKDVTETADTISNFWKNQAEELKGILQTKDVEFNTKITALTKDFTDQITGLTEKVGILTGQLAAEKNQNERLEKIFQGRNPEMEAFMKYMVGSSEQHSKTHEAMLKVLNDLHGMSESNHKILEKDLKVESVITKA